MMRCCWIQYHIPLNMSDSFSSSTVAWWRLRRIGNWSTCNNQGKSDTETSGVVYSLYPFWLLDGEWEQEGRLLVMELTFSYVDAYDHNEWIQGRWICGICASSWISILVVNIWRGCCIYTCMWVDYQGKGGLSVVLLFMGRCEWWHCIRIIP
jgi:hypothetical protein